MLVLILREEAPARQPEARGRWWEPAPLSAAPSGRLDLDAAPFRTRRLGDAHGEHTVIELRLDAFRVDLAWKHDPELELANPPHTPAGYAFALALLGLAADRQLVAGHLDVHVLAFDPRHLGLDDVRVLELLDVDRRDPSRRLVEHAPEGLIEHPPHAFVQLPELAQRAPALGSGSASFWKKLRHVTISFHVVRPLFAWRRSRTRPPKRGSRSVHSSPGRAGRARRRATSRGALPRARRRRRRRDAASTC